MANEDKKKEKKELKSLKEPKKKEKKKEKKQRNIDEHGHYCGQEKFEIVPKELGIHLTDKQVRFCLLYLETLDATNSYLEVYDCKNRNVAQVGVSNLLRNPQIVKFLNYLLEQMNCNPLDIDEVEILHGIKSIALDEKINASTRLKAFELLSKIKGMQSDKQELTTVINVSVKDDEKEIVEGDFIDINIDDN